MSSPSFARSPAIRPVDVSRDLPAIADLIEICFADTLDSGGRAYANQLRQMHNYFFQQFFWGQLQRALQWHQGFVWVEAGRVVGNVSLQPSEKFTQDWAIANVAVHPHYRQHGIASQLLAVALQWLSTKGAQTVSLQVDANNGTAVRLYQRYGFSFPAAFTLWERDSAHLPKWLYGNNAPQPAHPKAWQQYYHLARTLRPYGLNWLNPLRPQDLQLGWWQQFKNWLGANDQQCWVYAQPTGGTPLALLRLQTHSASDAHIQIIVKPDHETVLLPMLVVFGVRQLNIRHRVRLEYPTENETASSSITLQAAGFRPLRHLLWGRKVLNR